MRKARLNAKLLRLRSKAQNLDARCAASTDANEVKMLTEQRAEVQADIEDVEAEIKEIETEEARSAEAPASATPVNAGIVASFAATAHEARAAVTNVYESDEYRSAFMAYIQRGAAIPQNLIDKANEYRNSLPAEQRAGVAITSADTGAAIPVTVMREVINTIRKRYGNLYNKVTKTNVMGGVQFAAGALQASFKWINESTVAPREKVNALAKITFTYHEAEIRIAQSFLSALLTISDFETKLVEVIVTAYLQAMDYAIVKGDGVAMPLGILNDASVTNTVDMTAANMSNWTAWRKNFFAKLPLGYRDGEFIFAMSTVDSYLETMADNNNNPIFRQATGLTVNDGDSRDPNGSFFGRNISLVEPDILPDFDTASDGDVIGIFWQPRDYVVNENYGFTMLRYFDHETNEWVDKALTVVDGKLVNPAGVVLIKKKV